MSEEYAVGRMTVERRLLEAKPLQYGPSAGAQAGRTVVALNARDRETLAAQKSAEQDRLVQARAWQASTPDFPSEMVETTAAAQPVVEYSDDPRRSDYRPPPLREEMVFQYANGSGPGYGDEVVLIGSALASDESVRTLRWLEPKEFLADPRLRNVAQAILDQSDAGLPHDAAAVTALLRDRGQLPPEWDPEKSMRKVDPRGYALGAWESTAIPPDYARRCAIEVRAKFVRYALRRTLESGLQSVNGLTEEAAEGWDDTKAHVTPLAGRLTSWMGRIPPELDLSGEPVSSPDLGWNEEIPRAWDPAKDLAGLTAEELKKVPMPTPSSSPEPPPAGSNLGLPEHPKLTLGAKLAMQEAARHATTRGLR